MQRISFGKNAIFSVDIGIHPVVSGSAFYRAINIKTPGNFNTTSGPWMNYESPTQSIQAITELGFTVKASELSRVGVAMRGIPAGITALPASQTLLLKASFSW
jgi:hypothetical protein